MRLLALYRHQLVEEAAGRSDKFRRVLRMLRLFWIAMTLAGAAFAAFLFVGDVRNPYPGSGWSIIIGPFTVVLVAVAGYIPYGIGQLFLSVKASDNG